MDWGLGSSEGVGGELLVTWTCGKEAWSMLGTWECEQHVAAFS